MHVYSNLLLFVSFPSALFSANCQGPAPNDAAKRLFRQHIRHRSSTTASSPGRHRLALHRRRLLPGPWSGESTGSFCAHRGTFQTKEELSPIICQFILFAFPHSQTG